MRTLPIVLLLILALPGLADAEEKRIFEVVSFEKVEKGRLLARTGAWSIDLLRLAERVDLSSLGEGSIEKRAQRYMEALKPGELSVERVRRKNVEVVVGAWPISAKTDPADLGLEMKLTGPAQLKPADRPKLSIRLVNRSRTTAHRVVLPNDGSESAWREPHVFFSATVGGKKIEKKPIGRCGIYASDWHRDVVVIAPGQSIDLSTGYLPVRLVLALPKKGKVLLRAHYAFSRGANVKGHGAPKGTGRMGKSPSFELVTDPVEFKVGDL